MIIVDFQHLSYRNLYTCFYNCKPKKRDGKFVTEDFIGIYFYQMLTSLHYLQMDFKEYGEIVIALDGFKNWRKELLQDFYKAERSSKRAESEINFNEFFEYQKELEEFLKTRSNEMVPHHLDMLIEQARMGNIPSWASTVITGVFPEDNNKRRK